MGWAKCGFAGGLFLTVLAAGCQNKMYDENKALYDENKALRDQNERLKQQQGLAQNQTPAQPVAPVAPLTTTPGPVETPSAPPPPPKANSSVQVGDLETKVNARTGNTTVYVPSKLLFAPGQATLQPDAKKSMDQVVSALKKQFAGKKVRVEGHTDDTPIKVSKWASNDQLSLARADAVKQYLVAHGIDASRVTTKGYGASKPRDPSDKSKNRRVEVVVLTGPAAASE
ncbi:MAG TPA: OmpA family protein [Tepidisphaeraceae bacterium]|jgi:flagellar motor protein MotB|nr:OmpA family protein [Tepidisphaeraceae bacterium]